MRFNISGTSPVASAIRDALRRHDHAVSDHMPSYSLRVVEDADLTYPVLVGSGGEYMCALADNLCRYIPQGQVMLERAVGLPENKAEIRVAADESMRLGVETAVVETIAALTHVRGFHAPSSQPRVSFWRRLLTPLLLLLLYQAGTASAGDYWSLQHQYLPLRLILRQPNPSWVAIATTADPTWPEGFSVPLSVTLDGKLRVSGSFSGGGDGAIQDGDNAAIEATVFDLTNSNPLSTQIVDANGDAITSFGGGTQYTEDAAAAANPVGTALNLIRADTPGAVTDTDGDNLAQRGTNFGAGFVQVLTSAGAFVDSFGGGTEVAQGTAAIAAEVLKMGGAIRRDTAALDAGVADGDRAALSTDNVGRLRTTSEDVTQPISAASLPLPTGAATAALQDGIVKDGAGDTTQANVTSGRLNVDGSGVTQPISAAALPLPTGASTAALQDGIVKDGAGDTTQANVSNGRLHTDGSGVTQPISAASLPLPTGAATSAAQLPDGHNVTVDNAGAGAAVNIQDGGNTITVDGTVAVGTFPDNEPFNQAQRGGAAVVAGACERESVLYVQIDQTANEQLITGTASERIYICSIQLISATAQNVALVDGTGSVCATSPTGLLGGSTAATGWNFGANGGLVLPTTRDSWAKTSTDADNVCLLQSSTGQVSGSVTYVSIPNI